MEPTETAVVEVLRDGKWSSYSRCTPTEARTFMKDRNDVARWRVVDWITGDPILLAEEK